MIHTTAGARCAGELTALDTRSPVAADELRRRVKGPRLYGLALIAADSPQHWLLVRRSLHPNEIDALTDPMALRDGAAHRQLTQGMPLIALTAPPAALLLLLD